MTTHTSRTALITGASRGLGLALARALAARGWRLIIDARGAEALEAERGELARHTQVTAIAGDVTDAEHRAELAAAVAKAGGLDVLVNNAGVLGPSPQPALLAVGTTVVRALETVADERGTVHPGEGWTDLVISPQRGLRAVDGLLTGLHEPRSSHLAMLQALAGREHLEKTYAAALHEGYLWHEFGDLHLILP